MYHTMPATDALPRRRRAQQLVHDLLVDVAAGLSPGDTEQRADHMIRERLAPHIDARWFHEPYVWFGDRTAPQARRRIEDYRPSTRRLEPGMAVIFDAAPRIEG